jgi:hypothetical protein
MLKFSHVPAHESTLLYFQALVIQMMVVRILEMLRMLHFELQR